MIGFGAWWNGYDFRNLGIINANTSRYRLSALAGRMARKHQAPARCLVFHGVSWFEVPGVSVQPKKAPGTAGFDIHFYAALVFKDLAASKIRPSRRSTRMPPMSPDSRLPLAGVVQLFQQAAKSI